MKTLSMVQQSSNDDIGTNAVVIEVVSDVPTEHQLDLSFTGLSAFVQDASGERQILHGVNGDVLPKQVFALMGPSGSGKTTLLSILAGRTPRSMKITGTLTSRGDPMSKAVRRSVGYVSQDDLLHETLTVYETLYYAARLRLPREMDTAGKVSRALAVIDELGLDKCKGTVIGGYMMKGVSGGERKRVSIGLEMLMNPSILLLDEPTSGLDSTTAMFLLSTLSSLAAAGRAICTTIHQPSSRLYAQLHKLLLLANGHTLYYGDADKVTDYLSVFGLDLPRGVSIAEFILDVASGEVALKDVGPQESITELASRHRLRDVAPDADKADKPGNGHSRSKPELDMVAASGPLTAKRPVNAGGSFLVKSASSASGFVMHKLGRDRPGASFAQQFAILMARSLRARRSEAYAWQQVLQFSGLAVLVGVFWWQQGQQFTTEAASNTASVLFLQAMFVSWSTLFAALFTFPSEYQLLIKERSSGLYQLGAYYLSRSMADLPMDCALPALFSTILYFMTGMRLTAWAYFANLAAALLITLTAQGVGLFFGAVIQTPKTLMSLAIICMGFMMLVGGFFVRNLPGWIKWAQYLSFFYYGYNLLYGIQFSGQGPYLDCSDGPDACQPVDDISLWLGLPTSAGANTGLNVGLLFATFLLFRATTFYVLKHKTRKL